VSQENVETLQSFYQRLDATRQPPAELFHPDLEIHMFDGSAVPGPFLGLDGLNRWYEETFDVFEDGRLVLDEAIVGDDPDVMVVTNRFVGRMRHTGLAADFPVTAVVRFLDGRIVRFEGYRERAEAFKAVGLEE